MKVNECAGLERVKVFQIKNIALAYFDMTGTRRLYFRFDVFFLTCLTFSDEGLQTAVAPSERFAEIFKLVQDSVVTCLQPFFPQTSPHCRTTHLRLPVYSLYYT